MRCSYLDIEKVNRVMLHNSIFKYVTDDLVSDKDMVGEAMAQILDSPNVYVLMPNEDTVCVFNPINSITFDLHIAVVKGEHRKKVVKSLNRAGMWMLKNTPVRKFIAFVPNKNPHITSLVKKFGMKLEGNMSSAFLKNGKLQDVKIFGITDEEFITTIGGAAWHRV